MKSIALLDLDNTLYDGFSPFALLQELQNVGLARPASTDVVLACFEAYKAGTLPYEAFAKCVLDKLAAGLEGQPYAEVRAAAVEFYTDSPKMFAFAQPVLAMLQPSHDRILVTGDPQFIAEAVAEIYGLNGYHSSQYEVKNGVFTGRVTSYLATRHQKHDAVKHLLEGHARRGSFAFGDSEGDIEMLRAVEYPICVNAAEELQTLARERGWRLADTGEVEAIVQDLLQLINK